MGLPDIYILKPVHSLDLVSSRDASSPLRPLVNTVRSQFYDGLMDHGLVDPCFTKTWLTARYEAVSWSHRVGKYYIDIMRIIINN